MRILRDVAVTLVLLLAVQMISPVVYAADGGQASNSGPWWWTAVAWLVTNCITSYESGSWYDRVVCRRAARFIQWLIKEGGDVMCLSKFYDAVSEPSQKHRMALFKCLLAEELPIITP